MASSANHPVPPGTRSTSPTTYSTQPSSTSGRDDTPRSFASVVSSTLPPAISHLRRKVWLRGKEDHSVFFDLSGLTKAQENEFYVNASNSMRNICGMRSFSVGNPRQRTRRRIVETAFPSFEDCVFACDEGVPVGSSRLFPNIALPPDANITTLSLTDVPMNVPDLQTVREEIQQALAPFGNILDITLQLLHGDKIFSGRASVVIDRSLSYAPPAGWTPLRHKIRWNASSTRELLCTYKGIPQHCRFCHQEGHTRLECEARLQKVDCWNCGHTGHRMNDCPQPTRTTDRKKVRSTDSVTVNASSEDTLNKPLIDELPSEPFSTEIAGSSAESSSLPNSINDWAEECIDHIQENPADVTTDANIIMNMTPTPTNLVCTIDDEEMTDSELVTSFTTTSQPSESEKANDNETAPQKQHSLVFSEGPVPMASATRTNTVRRSGRVTKQPTRYGG